MALSRAGPRRGAGADEHDGRAEAGAARISLGGGVHNWMMGELQRWAVRLVAGDLDVEGGVGRSARRPQ